MANIHKLELYIVDAVGNYKEIQEIIDLIERHTDCGCKVIKYEGKEFDWGDDLTINYSSANIDDYEEYFK